MTTHVLRWMRNLKDPANPHPQIVMLPSAPPAGQVQDEVALKPGDERLTLDQVTKLYPKPRVWKEDPS